MMCRRQQRCFGNGDADGNSNTLQSADTSRSVDRSIARARAANGNRNACASTVLLRHVHIEYIESRDLRCVSEAEKHTCALAHSHSRSLLLVDYSNAQQKQKRREEAGGERERERERYLVAVGGERGAARGGR